MVRLPTRTLFKGSDVREITNKLRQNGNEQRFYDSIRRGDRFTAVNKILRDSGVQITRKEFPKLIGAKYSSKISGNYFDKLTDKGYIQENYSVAGLKKLGLKGKIRVLVEGINNKGETHQSLIDIDESEYSSHKEAIKDIQENIEQYESDTDGVTSEAKVLKIFIT